MKEVSVDSIKQKLTVEDHHIWAVPFYEEFFTEDNDTDEESSSSDEETKVEEWEADLTGLSERAKEIFIKKKRRLMKLKAKKSVEFYIFQEKAMLKK